MRTRIIGLIIVVLTQVSAYAQESGADLSPSGNFSISIASNYHFSPWNKLNDMLGVIGEQVKFNPSAYQNTTGSYDRINGDISLRLKAGYGVFEPAWIFLTSSYVRTGSDMKLNNSYEFLWAGTADQSMSFGLNIYSVGAGAECTFRVSRLFSLMASALGERSFGVLHFESESTSPSQLLKSAADMKSEVWSGQASVGVRMPLCGRISLLGAIDYRLLRFPVFTGSGSYVGTILPSSTWVSVNSSAKLVEGEHYLGVLYEPRGLQSPYPASYELTPSSRGDTPAILNMSGMGGSLGIEIEL